MDISETTNNRNSDEHQVLLLWPDDGVGWEAFAREIEQRGSYVSPTWRAMMAMPLTAADLIGVSEYWRKILLRPIDPRVVAEAKRQARKHGWISAADAELDVPLRALGADIAGDAIESPERQSRLEPDRDQIEIFVDAIFRHAGPAGYVSIRAFTSHNKPLHRAWGVSVNGNQLPLIEAAVDSARRAANEPTPAVFCPPLATFKGADGRSAKEANIHQGLVISVECDSHPDDAMHRLEEILGEATAVVRSGGQWVNGDGVPEDKLHLHWRLSTPAQGDRLKDLKEARRLACSIAGGDPTNIPAVHCLRWPGSWHRKATPRLCELVRYNPDVELDLAAALAALRAAAPAAAAGPASESNGRAGGEDWSPLIGNIVAGVELHRSITVLAAKIVAAGHDGGFAINFLRGLMDNSRAKMDRPKDWQARFEYIPRAVESALEKFKKQQKPGTGASPQPQQQKPRPGLVDPLAEAHKAFAKWFSTEYDLDVLDVVMATCAAEKLDHDPPWLMVISGAGNAKTETVQAAHDCDGARMTSTLSSVGALLSGAPRKPGSSGGLLAEIGERGLLIIKDFTSILTLDRNVRDAVLAALREIFDGYWSREVGEGGGRRLEWKGRLVVICACTTAWDQAHTVIAKMGDRFACIRADSSKGRAVSGAQAIRNIGQEERMREELAEAFADVVENVDVARDYSLTEAEQKIILEAADIITLARTAVELDYAGNVIDAHAPEMPTRLAKQLTQIMRGALAIGIDRQRALALGLRVARDSMPQLRLMVLRDVGGHPETPIIEVRRRLQKPRATIDRTLQALHFLGLLTCKETEVVRGDRTEWKRNYSLAENIDLGPISA